MSEVPARFYRTAPKGLLLSLRVKPKASSDHLEGIEKDENGDWRLVVRVRALPDKGKANKAVCGLIAKAVGLAKSKVEIARGSKSRHKTLLLAGDSKELAEKIGEKVRQLGINQRGSSE